MGVGGMKSYGMELFESHTTVLGESMLVLFILKFSNENSEANPLF